jgi:hypothetical protein
MPAKLRGGRIRAGETFDEGYVRDRRRLKPVSYFARVQDDQFAIIRGKDAEGLVCAALAKKPCAWLDKVVSEEDLQAAAFADKSGGCPYREMSSRDEALRRLQLAIIGDGKRPSLYPGRGKRLKTYSPAQLLWQCITPELRDLIVAQPMIMLPVECIGNAVLSDQLQYRSDRNGIERDRAAFCRKVGVQFGPQNIGIELFEEHAPTLLQAWRNGEPGPITETSILKGVRSFLLQYGVQPPAGLLARLRELGWEEPEQKRLPGIIVLGIAPGAGEEVDMRSIVDAIVSALESEMPGEETAEMETPSSRRPLWSGNPFRSGPIDE